MGPNSLSKKCPTWGAATSVGETLGVRKFCHFKTSKRPKITFQWPASTPISVKSSKAVKNHTDRPFLGVTCHFGALGEGPKCPGSASDLGWIRTEEGEPGMTARTVRRRPQNWTKSALLPSVCSCGMWTCVPRGWHRNMSTFAGLSRFGYDVMRQLQISEYWWSEVLSSLIFHPCLLPILRLYWPELDPWHSFLTRSWALRLWDKQGSRTRITLQSWHYLPAAFITHRSVWGEMSVKTDLKTDYKRRQLQLQLAIAELHHVYRHRSPPQRGLS